MPNETLGFRIEVLLEMYFAFKDIMVDGHGVWVMERVNANHDFIEEYS